LHAVSGHSGRRLSVQSKSGAHFEITKAILSQIKDQSPLFPT